MFESGNKINVETLKKRKRVISKIMNISCKTLNKCKVM